MVFLESAPHFWTSGELTVHIRFCRVFVTAVVLSSFTRLMLSGFLVLLCEKHSEVEKLASQLILS